MTIDKIMKISNKLEHELNERYGEYDLTLNQAELLIYFYNFNQNEISATTAIEDLKMDKRLMSLALKSLESKEYVIRYPNENDKRQKDIELSLSALEISEDLIAIKEEVNALFEANLNEEQIKIITNLEA